MAKTMVRLFSALGLILSVSACSSDDNTAETEKKSITRVAIENSAFKADALEATINKLVTELSATEPKSLKFHVNLKGITGYWEPVVVGANRAINELDVDGVVTAAPSEQGGDQATLDQIEMLKDEIDAGSDGFGISPMSSTVKESLDAAVDAGIPVVTIDSDIADSKREFYVGTLNAEAGKTGGETLKELLPSGAGTVIVLGNADEAWKDGYDRTMGARDVLAAAGYTVIVRTTSWDDGGEAADVAFMVETMNTADPPVVGMIGMFSNAFRCAMALEAAGKTGDDIAVAAFDFEAKTLEYMQSGMIKATHAQRQYYMGYLTPYILYGMNVLGEKQMQKLIAPHLVDAHRLDTGLDVVMASQLEEYYSFLDDLGVGGGT